MKKLFVVIIIALLVAPVQAQFNKARLQATGLTCAMCSNAIYKALKTVPFIDSVEPDIKNSAFDIVFKENEEVNIDALKDAVEDAGFSVGNLLLTGNFREVKLEKDKHVLIGKNYFHFLGSKTQTLNGEATIHLADKDFVTTKEFKKISSLTKMSCLQSGKAESCCTSEGIPAEARIYHVTI